jgi:GNAT superfamily N-acetyltransferase
LDRIVETAWGAVVTDRRFPSIWDVNYARVDAAQDDVRLEEISTDLEPELRRSGARYEHIVLFRPERQTHLLEAVGMRGDRISWDVVMAHPGEDPAPPAVDVEEVTSFDERFWARVRKSLAAFDVTDRSALDQLERLEREVALPDGKRWFAIRPAPRRAPLSLGALITHEGVGYVDHIVTFPEARGRGLGSAMVRRIVAAARESGVEHVFLLADRGEKPAELYRRLGFVDVATIASSVRKR